MGWQNKIRLFFQTLKGSDHDASELETTRCGRCAHILPDETLSYCPRCGIPFSRVPPTHSYETLLEHQSAIAIRNYRRKLIGSTLTLFVAFWALVLSMSSLHNEAQIHSLNAVRGVDFYFYEDAAYPNIPHKAKLKSVAVALQSFEDHFGIRIEKVRIFHNEIPDILQEHAPDFFQNSDRSSLAFWEYKIYPSISQNWDAVHSEYHPVLFTNIPIMNDLGQKTGLETAHLNDQGLISGLGHPTLTIASTYRLLREEDKLLSIGAIPDRDEALARFMGEYVVAHELGHALLAIPDYVGTWKKRRQIAALRGPASEEDRVDFSRCVMHTDPGGGYASWQRLSERQLGIGVDSPCDEYHGVLTAFKLRQRAIQLAQNSEKEKALALYDELLTVYRPSRSAWLYHQWAQERNLLLSAFDRWFK